MMLRFLVLLLDSVASTSCPCTNCYPGYILAPGAQEPAGLSNDSAPCGVMGYFQLASYSVIVPDSYTLMSMNFGNYTAWQNGEPYSYYSQWSVFNPVSCYMFDGIETTEPGFIIVLTCMNSDFNCHYTTSTVGNFTSEAALMARPCNV